MRERRMRLALALAAVALVAAGAVFAAGGPSDRSTAPTVAATSSDGELPAALSAHLAELSQAIPGKGGEYAESESAAAGSSAAGLQDFIDLAYPKKDIPLSSIKAARRAIAQAEARTTALGLAGSPEWEMVGPDTALYQFTPFRTARSYVPNEFAMAGRTTDLAIDPNCGSVLARGAGKCRMWIGPAGGGTGGTRQRAGAEPAVGTSRRASGSTRAARSRSTRTTRAANTIWVGTGEGNACGSGCVAGVGLYKSTDGGDHWSGPYGDSAFNARGVGSIQVKPGDPDTIYAASGVRVSRAFVGVLLRRRHPVPGSDPGRAAVGAVSVDERRCRPGRSCTTARRRRGRADRHRRDCEQPHAVLTAWRAAHRARSERTRTSSTRRRTRVASGDPATTARPGRRSSSRSTRDRHDSARHHRRSPAEWQDEDVRR